MAAPRKKACKRGHALEGENRVKWKSNEPRCKTCHRNYYREYMRGVRAAKRAAHEQRAT